MKILIINTCAVGASTSKIANGLMKRLQKDGHECRYFYGTGDTVEGTEYIKSAGKIDMYMQWAYNQLTGIHGGFAPRAQHRLKKLLDEFKPDLVQLYNVHGYYLDIFNTFRMLEERNLPIVYGMLDEYPYLGYCCYAYDCDQFQTGCHACDFKRFRYEYPRNLFVNGAEKTIKLKEKTYDYDRIIFTGPQWVLERARSSYLLRNKHLELLDEFIDTENVFYPHNTDNLRNKLKIHDKQVIILNVAPSNDYRKGVKYYVELARRLENNPQYVFVHVGFKGDTSDLPHNLLPVSFIKDQDELAQYYSLADLFICTSLADTMPNTCLDALACGTPVLGFRNTGVPYVAEEPLGKFVSTGDVDALLSNVTRVSMKTSQLSCACRDYAVSRYSLKRYYERTMEIYNQIMQ